MVELELFQLRNQLGKFCYFLFHLLILFIYLFLI